MESSKKSIDLMRSALEPREVFDPAEAWKIWYERPFPAIDELLVRHSFSEPTPTIDLLRRPNGAPVPKEMIPELLKTQVLGWAQRGLAGVAQTIREELRLDIHDPLSRDEEKLLDDAIRPSPEELHAEDNGLVVLPPATASKNTCTEFPVDCIVANFALTTLHRVDLLLRMRGLGEGNYTDVIQQAYLEAGLALPESFRRSISVDSQAELARLDEMLAGNLTAMREGIAEAQLYVDADGLTNALRAVNFESVDELVQQGKKPALANFLRAIKAEVKYPSWVILPDGRVATRGTEEYRQEAELLGRRPGRQAALIEWLRPNPPRPTGHPGAINYALSTWHGYGPNETQWAMAISGSKVGKLYDPPTIGRLRSVLGMTAGPSAENDPPRWAPYLRAMCEAFRHVRGLRLNPKAEVIRAASLPLLGGSPRAVVIDRLESDLQTAIEEGLIREVGGKIEAVQESNIRPKPATSASDSEIPWAPKCPPGMSPEVHMTIAKLVASHGHEHFSHGSLAKNCTDEPSPTTKRNWLRHQVSIGQMERTDNKTRPNYRIPTNRKFANFC